MEFFRPTILIKGIDVDVERKRTPSYFRKKEKKRTKDKEYDEKSKKFVSIEQELRIKGRISLKTEQKRSHSGQGG